MQADQSFDWRWDLNHNILNIPSPTNIEKAKFELIVNGYSVDKKYLLNYIDEERAQMIEQLKFNLCFV